MEALHFLPEDIVNYIDTFLCDKKKIDEVSYYIIDFITGRVVSRNALRWELSCHIKQYKKLYESKEAKDYLFNKFYEVTSRKVFADRQSFDEWTPVVFRPKLISRRSKH